MAYTYNVTDALEVKIKQGNKIIDTVGPWDSREGAEQWAQAVCDKYNAPEYANTPYPNDLEALNA